MGVLHLVRHTWRIDSDRVGHAARKGLALSLIRGDMKILEPSAYLCQKTDAREKGMVLGVDLERHAGFKLCRHGGARDPAVAR